MLIHPRPHGRRGGTSVPRPTVYRALLLAKLEGLRETAGAEVETRLSPVPLCGEMMTHQLEANSDSLINTSRI